MHFRSLNNASPTVDFAKATIQGIAPDKGLYFPLEIPRLPAHFINNLKNLSKEEIGFAVIKPYLGASMPDDVLRTIIEETINFPFPLVPVSENIYSLELFHGLTLAFKDVGARFMSRCLQYFHRNEKQPVTVLVATSGDTGGAVANGFLGVEGVDVVILYPSGKVSHVQELQLTTLGKNIQAIEVSGSFDDCQRMVKMAFADEALNKKRMLTSANSINIARWLPQQLYYFFACQQWPSDAPPVFSVPSGNFGNICAGILAQASGLPVKHFIAACNSNDTVPSYLISGNYQPKMAVATLSNAMDVGDPSNFVRIMEIFHQQFQELKNKVTSESVDDATTAQTILEVYKKYGYLLDPHGSVAYTSLQHYLVKHPEEAGIFLETAHPIKFPETVEKITGQKIEIPQSINELFTKEKQSVSMDTGYESLKAFLLN